VGRTSVEVVGKVMEVVGEDLVALDEAVVGKDPAMLDEGVVTEAWR
jgi:hypothetical protein